jgi:hypothetical protein
VVLGGGLYSASTYLFLVGIELTAGEWRGVGRVAVWIGLSVGRGRRYVGWSGGQHQLRLRFLKKSNRYLKRLKYCGALLNYLTLLTITTHYQSFMLCYST